MIGKVLIALAVLMVVPIIVAAVYGEKLWDYLAFVIPVAVLLPCGIGISFIKPKDKTKMRPREGMVMVAVSWLLFTLLGALPYYISGALKNFFDCIFETASGFTTTGVSVILKPENLSRSINFWRCFTHWIGGMGILVFIQAVLPKGNEMQSIHIFRAESPGPQVSKIVSNMGSTAKILYLIYIFNTILQTIFLLCGKMPFYDSIVCSFSTVSTGGFSIWSDSIAHYNSLYIEMVVAVFMMLNGINYSLFFLLITGKALAALKNTELWVYIAAIIAGTVALTVSSLQMFDSIGRNIADSFFQVTSVISSTGFVTVDFNAWGSLARLVLILLMFMGACAGSTGGGFKVSRMILLGKNVHRYMKKLGSPNSVSAVKMDGKSVDDALLYHVVSMFAIYIAIVAVGMVWLAIDGAGIEDALVDMISCMSNIGPGYYNDFHGVTKLFLSVVMIAGRLEIMPIIILALPRTWRKA